MKKILTLGITAVLLCAGLMVSVAAAKSPNPDLGNPDYVLNLIGKKDGWNGGGSYDNFDRHTIFVPACTDEWKIDYIWENGEEPEVLEGIRIDITQGEEFGVIDGNGCDGCAAFQVGPGQYDVCLAVKGKPGGEAQIDGWVKCNDTYYLNIGSTGKISKKDGWKDVTDIFYVSGGNNGEDPFEIVNDNEGNYALTEDGMWVFDYLAALQAYSAANSLDFTNPEYFWQFVNDNTKLIQIRFYEK